ncbi:MAG: hypothetical protein M0Z31_05345 [Clostridia bacterium]|nr:hypothetical protein [Clostridia bacterium]
MPVTIVSTLPNENAAQIKGFFDDIQIRYNPFFQVPGGAFDDAAANPVYHFHYPTMQPVPGAFHVFSKVPGEAGYSPIWRIHMVIVPTNTRPNEDGAMVINNIPLVTVEAINASGLQIMPHDLYMNAPLVSEVSFNGAGRPLSRGWYRGLRVFYFSYEEFGRLPGGGPAPSGAQKPAALPLYTFVLPDNTPVLGAVNVFSSSPTSTNYSPIWLVQGVRVPAGTVANQDGSVSIAGIKLSSERAIKAGTLPLLTSVPGFPRYIDGPIVEISGTKVQFP